jgi:hypothetical protein
MQEEFRREAGSARAAAAAVGAVGAVDFLPPVPVLVLARVPARGAPTAPEP